MVNKMPLSRRVTAVNEALSIYINQLVYDLRRRNVPLTTLSLGEAFFEIKLQDFNRLNKEKGYHYSDSRGIPELRRKICDFYGKQYGARLNPDTNILVTAGSKPAIYMTLLAMIDPGDEVLIHEPAWLSYPEHVRLLDGISKFIPFDLPVNDFPAHFTPRTRALILNNPNNPAGHLYSAEELRELHRACRARGIYIIMDEAYSDFVLNEDFPSMATVVPDLDGVVVVNSLSKNMGMSGWRLGYAISNPVFIDHLLKLNQHLITCAPSILQYYVAEYFDEIIGATLPQVRKVVEKRRRIAAVMDQIGLVRLPGASTFYFFVSIGDFSGTSMEFAIHLLLRHGIAVVPGSAYGESTERFIRISIGTEDESRIVAALSQIKDAIEMKEFSSLAQEAELRKKGLPLFAAGSKVR